MSDYFNIAPVSAPIDEVDMRYPDRQLSGQRLLERERGAEQESGIGDTLSLWGEAAYKGSARGLFVSTPDTFYRSMRSIGDMIGYQDMQDWATEHIDDLKRRVAADPFYQPDEDIMNDPIAKSIYGGFDSVISSFAMAAPGALIGAATGGVGFMPIMFGFATSAGSAAGLAEYDRFVDDAYGQFSQVNPDLTWQQVQDTVHSQALVSAIAEGGFEFAGDLLAGKLLGAAGKAVTGAGWQFHRKFAAKLLKNTLLTGPLAEMPTELATAAVQDKAREWAGLDHQGMVSAMQESFGPAWVASMLGGGAKTMIEHATNSNVRDTARQAFEQGKAEKMAQEAELRTLLEQNEVVKALAGDDTAMVDKALLADAMELFRKKGNDGEVIEDGATQSQAEGFLKFLKGEKDFNQEDQSHFEVLKGNLETKLTEAQKLGLLPEGAPQRMAELYHGFKLPEPRKFSKSMMSKAIAQQFSENAGMKDKVKVDDLDSTTNNSILNHVAEDQQNVLEFIDVAAPEIERLRNRDTHRFNELAKRGLEALQSGFAAHQVKLHSGIVENFDHVVAATGMLHEIVSKEATDSGLEMLRSGDPVDAAIYALKLEEANSIGLEYSKMGTSAGRALNALKAGKGLQKADDTIRKANLVLQSTNRNGEKSMLAALTRNLLEVATPKDKNKVNAHADKIAEVMGILNKNPKEVLTQEEREKVAEFFRTTTAGDLSRHVHSKSRWGRTRDLVLDSGISGMLMGFSTHVANTVGNAMTTIMHINERMLGSFIGDEIGISRQESMQMIHGLVAGFPDALRSAWGAFSTGASNFGFDEKTGLYAAQGFSSSNFEGILTGRKYDLSREELHAANGFGGMAKYLYRSIDFVGDRFVHLPGRTMLGCDEFFKTLVYHVERRSMAYREGMSAQSSGGDFQKTYDAIMDGKKAPQGVHEELMKTAAYITFQDAPKRGSWQDYAEQVRRRYPSTLFIVPFFRTGLNIAKWVGTRTPGVARMFAEYREQMSSDDPTVRQLAEARMLTGTMMWYTGMTLAAEGILTGSAPDDRNEREKLYATGWRPNSVKIGDKYYELTRLDPIATFLNAAATFMELQDDLEPDQLAEAGATLLASAVSVTSDKYYFQGLAKFVNAVHSPERYGPTFIRDLSSTFLTLPGSGLRRSFVRATDPVIHETDTYFENLRRDMPFVSTTLAPRRTMLGEVVTHQDDPLTRLFSPVRYGEAKKDPVYNELLRLHKIGAFTGGKPSRYLTIGGERVKLTAQQYSRYLEIAGLGLKRRGRNVKQAIAATMNSSQYRRISEDDKGRVIKRIVDTYRRRARQELIRSDPELAKLYLKSKQNKKSSSALTKLVELTK